MTRWYSSDVKKIPLSSLPFTFDWHCHLLPGVDDGSQHCEVSSNILRMMADYGVRRVTLRLHINPDIFISDGLGTTVGAYGEGSMKIIKYLIKKDWYTYVGSDTHTLTHFGETMSLDIDRRRVTQKFLFCHFDQAQRAEKSFGPIAGPQISRLRTSCFARYDRVGTVALRASLDMTGLEQWHFVLRSI
ncbi:MAG: CpsB/CapC family capsule biosynthesis tyrosine phosphatase [Candidatus Cryptobacteroides sp.]